MSEDNRGFTESSKIKSKDNRGLKGVTTAREKYFVVTVYSLTYCSNNLINVFVMLRCQIILLLSTLPLEFM